MKKVRVPNPPTPVVATDTESLMTEMSRLYRERIRALYNNDTAGLQMTADQIELIKKKLAAL